MDQNFAAEVKTGLSSKPKYLPSKYFYNEKGDQLFQKIMHLDDYYPTDCEFEIFEKEGNSIANTIKQKGHFELVELGAGDGLKTKLLLEELIKQKADFTYIPIDISADVLSDLEEELKLKWPQLKVESRVETYFEALKNLDTGSPKVILFLGANIGNFKAEKANQFLQELAQYLSTNDLFLSAFDLKKLPEVILNAYNDEKGVTKAFNLNLLRRINEELEANFELSQFDHYPTYDPHSGEAKSFLISLKEQKVQLKKLGTVVHFEKAEAIFTEVSKKYNLSEIESLAEQSGFQVLKNFSDSRDYFIDSLWRKA
ncbi:MAG: L-histidine N(alpha)-methyltransferase [Vicingaceae bacterium]